jgi:predicted RNase H-like HicB family nuclease
MTKDLTFYQALPYAREWLPRDDESGRYFVVRLEAIPEIYGAGYTKQAALAELKSAFDDQIIWCLEEGLEIPEPGLVPAQSARSIEITMVRIAPTGPTSASHESGETKARTQTAEIVESFRSSKPIDVGALQKVA